MERTPDDASHPLPPHPPAMPAGSGFDDPAVLAYWTVVDPILVRTTRRLAGQDADDVYQRVAAQFFADPHRYMASYTPERFANVAAHSRADDHRRTERIQRCEGARLRIDAATGLARPAREVCALESLDPEHDHFGFDDDTFERILDNDRLRTAMQVLDPRIAKLLVLVEVDGYTVTEAAPLVGFTRSYASRTLTAAKRLLAELIIAA